MFIQLNVIMKLSNVSKRKKKKKKTIECDKSTVTFDVGITQCNNRNVKCEEKIKVPPNVRKVRSI